MCVLCVFGPRQFNHSILGIHMHGNAARVDVAGFVIPLAHHHHHDGDDHHELPSPLPSRPSSPPHTTTSGRIADRPTTTIAGARAATARPAPGTPGTPGAAPARPMTAAAVQAARLQAAASNSGVGEGTSVAMARSHKHNTAAHLNQSTLYGRRKHRIGAGEDKALGIAMFRCVLRACLSMCRVGAAPLTLSVCMRACQRSDAGLDGQVNCWVCQPWSEVRIAVTIPESVLELYPTLAPPKRRSVSAPTSPRPTSHSADRYLVRLHASFDNWKACDMALSDVVKSKVQRGVHSRRDTLKEFFVYRMLPPGWFCVLPCCTARVDHSAPPWLCACRKAPVPSHHQRPTVCGSQPAVSAGDSQRATPIPCVQT